MPETALGHPILTGILNADMQVSSSSGVYRIIHSSCALVECFGLLLLR